MVDCHGHREALSPAANAAELFAAQSESVTPYGGVGQTIWIGAASPVDLIIRHLGADTTARYVTAWHRAFDQATDRGGITLTTPVVYLIAYRGARRYGHG